MTTQSIALFKAMGAKMDFLNMRQRLISQNIANSDTPGYKPQDLKPVDFGTVLKDVSESKNVTLETTSAMHMPNPNAIENTQAKKQKHTYEVAPAGNAVIMEEQLIQGNQVMMDYNLMTNLYQKNIGMIRTALGRNG
jgi:flagellar basal-body rod protein FlgB